MRAMWRTHGKPGGAREGYVDRPYTAADAEARLAEVSGDRAFASDFFSRYIQGREAADYARAAAQRAGSSLRKRDAGRAWRGDVRMDPRTDGARITAEVPANSPAYAAGIDEGDAITQMAGERTVSAEDVNAAIGRRQPGDRVLDHVRRSRGRLADGDDHAGRESSSGDRRRRSGGGSLTPAQRTFRERWLEIAGSDRRDDVGTGIAARDV